MNVANKSNVLNLLSLIWDLLSLELEWMLILP